MKIDNLKNVWKRSSFLRSFFRFFRINVFILIGFGFSVLGLIFLCSSNLFYRLSEAYISGFIFYLLTVVSIDYKKRKRDFEKAKEKISILYQDLQNMVVVMASASKTKLEKEEASREELSYILKVLSLYGEAPIRHYSNPSERGTWIEYFIHNKTKSSELISDLLGIIEDVEIQEILSKIKESKWYNYLEIVSQMPKLENENLEAFEREFCEYYLLIKELKEYFNVN